MEEGFFHRDRSGAHRANQRHEFAGDGASNENTL